MDAGLHFSFFFFSCMVCKERLCGESIELLIFMLLILVRLACSFVDV